MKTAFKEWAAVCEALGNGRQSVLIRKGGIAEGREGFSFRHSEFFLFPTWFHEQLDRTTLPADTELPAEPADEIEIRYAATVEWTGLVTDWVRVQALRDLHVLHEDVVAERYAYDDADGVHVAFVRTYRLEPPLRLKNEKAYGGCKSWIEIPEREGIALVSVLSDEEHARKRRLLTDLLGL